MTQNRYWYLGTIPKYLYQAFLKFEICAFNIDFSKAIRQFIKTVYDKLWFEL